MSKIAFPLTVSFSCPRDKSLNDADMIHIPNATMKKLMAILARPSRCFNFCSNTVSTDVGAKNLHNTTQLDRKSTKFSNPYTKLNDEPVF